MDREALEVQLDDFSIERRRAALADLAAGVEAGTVHVPRPGNRVNLHCHSFFSYNGYGYSPSRIVWMARSLGLAHVGLVDFDVLDGVDEFHDAGRLLGIKTHAGLETRAYLPRYAAAGLELNAPGEPGVAYHMGTGFVSGRVPDAARTFLADLRDRARARNLAVLAAVNGHLDPVTLDYEADVLPLTPAGNATERHICAAYQRKAEVLFPDRVARATFWTERLGKAADAVIDDPVALQGLIRSATIKRGGVGYRQPDEHSFPHFRAMNAFVLASGGIPTMAWLDGFSAGEHAVDELLDHHCEAGLEAVAVIPDRNWNLADPELRRRKVAELERFVAACDARGLPIQVGTELNAPGLKLVDDFDAPELAGVVDSFRRGADVVFGHAVSRARDGHGYCSAWARERFPDRRERNAYFARLGRETAALPAP